MWDTTVHVDSTYQYLYRNIDYHTCMIPLYMSEHAHHEQRLRRRCEKTRLVRPGGALLPGRRSSARPGSLFLFRLNFGDNTESHSVASLPQHEPPERLTRCIILDAE